MHKVFNDFASHGFIRVDSPPFVEAQKLKHEPISSRDCTRVSYLFDTARKEYQTFADQATDLESKAGALLCLYEMQKSESYEWQKSFQSAQLAAAEACMDVVNGEKDTIRQGKLLSQITHLMPRDGDRIAFLKHNDLAKIFKIEAQAWSQLGQLFVEHKEEVADVCPSFLTVTDHEKAYSYYPDKQDSYHYKAGACFAHAATAKWHHDVAIGNHALGQNKHTQEIEYLDRAVTELKQVPTGLEDDFLRAHLFESIAALLSKKTRLQSSKETQKECVAMSKKAAKLFQELAKEHPNFHYHTARNLSMSARLGNPNTKAATLKNAAHFAARFLEYRGRLPTDYFYRSSFLPVEQEALDLIVTVQ